MSAVITGVGMAVRGLRDERDLLAGNAGGEGESRVRETGFDLDAEPVGKGMRHKDRASRLALRAAGHALADYSGDFADPDSVAVIVSSNLGNLDTVCEFIDTIAQETVAGLSPMRVPHMSSNVTACWVALQHGLRGPNLTLCSGVTSGLDAMYWARNLLAVGRAEVALVIGVEPDTKPVERLYREQGAESWLDGAVCLVVETGRHAEERGVEPRAVIAGYGRAGDRESAVLRAVEENQGPIGLHLGESGLDVTAQLGRCSGALGVLQCAAGVAWLDGNGEGSVLAIAGTGPRDSGSDLEGDRSGVAALLLTGPESTRKEV